jgi:hypothetical protein
VTSRRNAGDEPVEPASATLSHGQGFGCLALAALSLLAAGLCLALGARCMSGHGLFDCIGLLTVFPAAFALVGLGSAAVGLQRFTTAGRGVPRTAPPGLGTVWRPVRVERAERPRPPGTLPDVIYLSGSSVQRSVDAGAHEHEGEHEAT